LPSLSIEVNLKYSKAKFRVGDEVLIKTRQIRRINTVDGFFKHGIILEVVLSPKLRGDSVDEWYYRVEYDPLEGRSLGNHKYTDYFNETELDYTLQKKREDKLNELGI